MYNLSKDYEKLYLLLCEGKTVVCYIDNCVEIGENKYKFVRVLCEAKRYGEYNISFRVRGVGYGGVDSNCKKNGSEKSVFSLMCGIKHLEYIPPPDPRHETLWKLFEEFQRQNQSAAPSQNLSEETRNA